VSKLTQLMMTAVVLISHAATTFELAHAEKKNPKSHSLFNGKDLTGWEGDLELWKVEKGMIVGDSSGIKHSQFLSTKTQHKTFELKLEFRLLNGIGNSGIQFRSKRVPESTEIEGYQADLGQKYWGCLYDESRRRRILAQAPTELNDHIKKKGWNKYVIRAEGNRIVLSINGFQTVNYVEQDESIPQSGVIALQVHSGPPLRVEFRNLRITEFP